MLAGRPHEAVGNGSPRWMTAAPRKRAHRTRPTGRLTPSYGSDLARSVAQMSIRAHSGHICLGSAEGLVERVMRTLTGLETRWLYRLVVMDLCPIQRETFEIGTPVTVS
jgi:hypothetical protein